MATNKIDQSSLYVGGARSRASTSTLYKLAGGFWIANAAYTIYIFATWSAVPIPIPLSAQNAELVLNLKTVAFCTAALLYVFLAYIALGMILDLRWVRRWAKVLGWIGVVVGPIVVARVLLRPYLYASHMYEDLIRLSAVFLVSILTTVTAKP